MAEVQTAPGASAKDSALMGLSVLVLLAGIAAFYWYDEQALALRIAMVSRVSRWPSCWPGSAGMAENFGNSPRLRATELRKVVCPRATRRSRPPGGVYFRDCHGFFFWDSTGFSPGSPGVDRPVGLTDSERLCRCDGTWCTPTRISEHKVSESLKERVKRAGLEAKFGEILVPTEEVVEMARRAEAQVGSEVFPGYVLVQMEMDEDTWHLVKEVPKVLGFIGGTSDKPAAITDKEAMSILRRVEEGVDKPKPKVLFEPGEVVRVTDGPFNDFNGVVESVNYEKNRLQVAVQILGRSTPVELDFSQVERVRFSARSAVIGRGDGP